MGDKNEEPGLVTNIIPNTPVKQHINGVQLCAEYCKDLIIQGHNIVQCIAKQ